MWTKQEILILLGIVSLVYPRLTRSHYESRLQAGRHDVGASYFMVPQVEVLAKSCSRQRIFDTIEGESSSVSEKGGAVMPQFAHSAQVGPGWH